MALREVFARFSYAFDGAAKLTQAERATDKLAKKTEQTRESFASLGGGLVSAVAGGALVSGLNHFAEQLDVLDDLSAQTKVATDDLQVYGFAAQKSGASVEEFNASLSLLQKSLGKTTEAAGPQVEALNKLKIDTSKPRELNEVLPEIFENFGKLKSSNEKAAVATQLFGRAGVRLIPTLERGKDGIAELRKELEESGGIVSAETIARAGEYRDNLARLDRSFFALKGTIAGALFPQLSKVVEGMAKAVGHVSDFVKGTTLADNAVIALGASLAGPLMGALRPFLGRGLKFAAIFGAVDDVIGFLEGKDSLIGRLLDGAFGDGTATAVRMYVNDAIDQFAYLASSQANALAVMESQNSSSWAKMGAAATVFIRDLANGFPIIRTGAALVWVGLVDDFQNAILKIQIVWNQFLHSLDLPDWATQLLKFDTKDAFKRTQESGAARTEAGIAASAAVNRVSVDEQRAREAGGNFKTIAEDAAPTALFGGVATNQFGPPPETRAQRIERERGEVQKQATALAPAAVQGTLEQAAAQGTVATLNDNKTVNINFPPGTSSAQKAEIKAAVAEALRSENRTALEALTQKGKK